MARMFLKPQINPVEDTAARSAFRKIIDWIEDMEALVGANFDRSSAGGSASIIQPTGPGAFDHGALSGLGDDDHAQYALLAGRAGGQTLYGGNASGDDLELDSTSHATKGTIRLGPSGVSVDETAKRLDIESAGAMRFVPGAAADRVLTVTNASGDVALQKGKVRVSKNGGAEVGPRPRLNLIEGTGVTLTVADDAGNDEVDVTIASAAGLSDGDYGDVTVSGGGTVMTIDPGAVDASKIANRTRVLDLPVQEWATTGATAIALAMIGTSPNRYNQWPFTTAGPTQAIYTMFRVPDDYVSGGRLIVLWTTQNLTPDDNPFIMRARYFVVTDVAEDLIGSQVGLTGAASTISKTSTNVGLLTPLTPRAISAAQAMARLDMGADFTGLAAGKIVRLILDRDRGAAGDTYADTINVVHVYMTYTADS
jgi:hypothetical protein